MPMTRSSVPSFAVGSANTYRSYMERVRTAQVPLQDSPPPPSVRTHSRISPGRHYFGCGGVILACFDPRADGDPWDATPNPDHVYLAVGHLEAIFDRVAGQPDGMILRPIETQPWGERSFYCTDPFGNKLCFVDEGTLFTAGLI